jgi:hypothetical protein
MTQPFALISSTEINHEEFVAFLKREGAELTPDDVYDGRISRGELHVWILLDNSNLNDLEAFDNELIMQGLGKPPKTYITLDVSREQGSEQLAIEFAYACAEKWPCIVYNLLNKTYSKDDLYRLLIAGKGFEE